MDPPPGDEDEHMKRIHDRINDIIGPDVELSEQQLDGIMALMREIAGYTDNHAYCCSISNCLCGQGCRCKHAGIECDMDLGKKIRVFTTQVDNGSFLRTIETVVFASEADAGAGVPLHDLFFDDDEPLDEVRIQDHVFLYETLAKGYDDETQFFCVNSKCGCPHLVFIKDRAPLLYEDDSFIADGIPVITEKDLTEQLEHLNGESRDRLP